MSKITNDGLTRSSTGSFIDILKGIKGLLAVATASKGFGTAGTTGRSIAPETLKLQGQGVFFLLFVCFINLLNMKFVIGAYKRMLMYVVLNCIIASSLGIYAEFFFPVVEF